MRFQPYISEMAVSKLACFYRTFDFQHQHSSDRKYFCRKKKRILASFIRNIPRNSQRAAHLKEECKV